MDIQAPIAPSSPHPGIFMSPSIDKLATALAKAQGEIKPAAKDSVNPHFKSKYADLAAIDEASREALAKNGLAVVQLPRATGRTVTMVYALLHTSGQYLGSDLSMTAQQDTPQAIGGCITYQRRYTKAALVGISQEDDDGNSASSRSHAPVSDDATIYDGVTQELKNKLGSIAKKHGITQVEDLKKLSKACTGMELINLEAAVIEWKQDNEIPFKS